jgi:dihydroxyacetone kinase-like protein
MQKLLNNPADAVLESLQGLQLAYPHLLCVNEHPTYVKRKDAPVKGKVAVISGSGSGHEPLNVGYVGRGMLDAACAGPIFTSPTPDQYLAATRAVYGDAGALYIVKNYMGGVLNSEMAMEMAADEGFVVRSVLINDDVAVEQKSNRRGMGAAVLVEKIAGAAAEAGYDLDGVAAVAQRASLQARSMGVALSSCTSPNVGRPTFHLPDHQMEVGVGIHGEQGRQRIPLAEAHTIAEMLVDSIALDLALRPDDETLVLVSGLGSTPQLELFVFFYNVYHALSRRSVRIERQLVGNYITSLDMAGGLVTVLRLDRELTALWDAPVWTPTLRW